MTALRADEAKHGLSFVRERPHPRPAYTARLARDAEIEFKPAVVVRAPSSAAKQATVTRTRHTPVLSKWQCHWCSSVQGQKEQHAPDPGIRVCPMSDRATQNSTI